MHYTVYKITNQIDGKIYIGSHKTENLDDNYMGSGKYLIAAQKKYGIENFVKEILFVFDTAEEMYAKEAELVNEEFLATENTYNLKVGGFGGWDFNNSDEGQRLRQHSYTKWHTSGVQCFVKRFNEDSVFREAHINHMKRISKKGHEALREKYPEGPFKGKKHSDDFKQKMSEIMSVKSFGANNSQYGTRWIHSIELKISKKIMKNDLLPAGWLEGRKIKW